MSFFKNKHIIAAMIVSPLLALVAYFAVDLVVKEKPHVAVAGQAYPMVAKSNCRFTSGECTLENSSFSTQLTVEGDTNVLLLKSSHPLQNATIGFVDTAASETSPERMQAIDSTNTRWQLELPSNISSDTIARVALRANDAFYFAETSLQFSTYETLFDKDLRTNINSITRN